MASKILVVDDEKAVSDLIAYNLRKNGFEPILAGDGRLALQIAAREKLDLILLDLMLPELDGMQVCREIRKTSKTPIIMVTARGEEIDRVVGLELGADDYLCKPFSMRELMARIRAVLRRSTPDAEDASPDRPLEGPGGLKLDPSQRKAWLEDRPINLTRLEFDLLFEFVRNPGRVYSRDKLLELAWGYDFPGDTRAVDSAIKRLRAKLREAGPRADCIESVRGIGYRLKDPDVE
jgi:DNA-binding response OmpR family regulator